MQFQTVAAERETDREKLSFWAKGTHTTELSFQKQLKFAENIIGALWAIPKVEPINLHRALPYVFGQELVQADEEREL